MKKRMEAIEIETRGDSILLNQDMGGEQATVGFPVDQVDAVIQWLQEAKAEILADPSARASE